MVHDVASDADCSAGVFANSSNLSTLQFDIDKPSRHNLGSVRTGFFLLGDNRRVCASTAAEDGGTVCPGANVEHLGSNWNHMNRQTVSSPARLGSQNTGIDNTSHAIEQVLRNTCPVALNDISSPHAIRCDNVALLASSVLCYQSDMGASAGVVLDAIDCVRSRSETVEVDRPDSPLVTTSAMPDGNSTRVVSASFGLSLFGEGKREERPALP